MMGGGFQCENGRRRTGRRSGEEEEEERRLKDKEINKDGSIY